MVLLRSDKVAFL